MKPYNLPRPSGNLQTAIDGSLHVLEQADKAGITKIVTTSSVVTYSLPKGPFTPECMCQQSHRFTIQNLFLRKGANKSNLPFFSVLTAHQGRSLRL